MTIVMGIDPGAVNVGYGVVTSQQGKVALRDFGAIAVHSRDPLKRLAEIHADIERLIQTHQPDVVATERLLFSANRKTAMQVAQSIGVIMLAISRANAEWAEYSPVEVKQALTGYGQADKRQVQYMVANVLAMESQPTPDHAADALAVAICHAHCAWTRALTG